MDRVTLLNDGQDADVHVSWEDQQKINRYSQLNILLTEREVQLAKLNQQVEALDDAVDLELEEDFGDDDDDLLESDDEEDSGKGKEAAKPDYGAKATTPYHLGDAFIMVSRDEAQQMLEKDRQQAKELQNRYKSEISKFSSEMDDLKKRLYSRFGTAIQLERD